MKRLISILALCALIPSLLFQSGCARSEENGTDSTDGYTRRIGITMESASDSKVGVSDDSDGTCVWTSGDQIAIRIVGSAPFRNAYSAHTVDASDNSVLVDLSGDQDINYYSVYPASACVDANYGNPNLHVVYASQYAFPKGLDETELNQWSPIPMVAVNTDASSNPLTSIVFYHVGGLLRVKLNNYTSTGVTAVKVTLEGMQNITGTYKVNLPVSNQTTCTLVDASGTGNEITYTVPSGLTLPDELWLNVPLPTGDYSALSGVKVTMVSSGSSESMTRAVKWGQVRHAQGKRLDFDLSGSAGSLDYVGIGSVADVNLWVGETHLRTALGYDANGIAITGAAPVWSSSNNSVASVNASSGEVTANSPGSATITASITHEGVTKTANYTVYVNQITGLTLKPSAEMFLRHTDTAPVTATLEYTRNGALSEENLQVQWSLSATGNVGLASTTTISGVENSVTGLAIGGPVTLTVRVPANTYGTHALLEETLDITVVGTNFIPGRFSISPTNSVFFSSGNLVVEYTNVNGSSHRDWKFAEHQYDYYADDMTTLPPPAGKTIHVDHFGWATAGVKNGSNAYGYDSGHTRYLPQHTQYSENSSTFGGQYNKVRYGPSYTPSVGWAAGDFLPFGLVAGNSWNAGIAWDLVRPYCDWGVHFDDDGVGSDSYRNGSWFTMSAFEWKYLFEKRENASILRGVGSIYDPVKKNYINGLILLPDNFVAPPEGCTFMPIMGDFATNVYSDGDASKGISGLWSEMEKYGAVFLPVPGERNGTEYYIYQSGGYWTSSAQIEGDDDNGLACVMWFDPNAVGVANYYKYKGLCVRLVRALDRSSTSSPFILDLQPISDDEENL